MKTKEKDFELEEIRQRVKKLKELAISFLKDSKKDDNKSIKESENESTIL